MTITAPAIRIHRPTGNTAMNRTKSILLAATALAMFAAPQVASAQSVGAAVVFLPAPAGGDAGTNTSVGGISADGTRVSGSNLNIPVIWLNGVPQMFDATGRYINERISGNGLVTSGYNPDQQAKNTIIWTAATGSFLVADRSPTEIATGAAAIDSSGTYFAVNTGTYDPNSTFISRNIAVYRWTIAGGYQSLGSFGPTWALRGNGISGDGTIIVGEADDRSVSPTEPFVENRAAFRWSVMGGLSRLSDLSATPGVGLGTHSSARGISRDGSTIVGESRGSDGFVQAVYWRSSSITGLGFLPGLAPTGTGTTAPGSTHALAANADGSIIVGSASGVANDRAWRWTAASGMQDLNLFATNAGLNLNGFVLTDAVGVSDNGQFITGNSFNAAQGQFLGYVLQLAQITQSRLVVTIRLPGVTQTSIVNQTFSTQVDAKLNGATVFTRTVTDPITGAGGVTALADARASLQQTSGLRRVVIGAPVLISNTTTVLGTTNAVVDIASGTTTSTATVNAFGPATVATGNLGTCATAAANNTNPTGCSLAGTPVTVDAGILNSNVFTNTINSVTPTTTPTVNQLITAKWQVSATAGNQFGTVHALTGVAAFDRGDRLIGQLLGMGGSGQGESATRLTRAVMPMHDANGFGGGDSGLTMFGGYFGNWSHIDADASVPVADVKGSTNGFVLGLEKRLGAARVGVAVDHGTSDFSVRDATYPETLSFKHTQLALFAGWQGGGFSLDGAAAYGFGTARTSLVTPTTPATGKRDVKSWSLGAQVGYTVPLGKSASVELVGGVRHTSAKLYRFTEVGGPSPLIGLNQTVTRTRVYAGIEAQAGIDLGGINLTPRIHARYAHDSGDASGVADLVFASAPAGPVMQAVGPGVGRDVAELGGSLDAAVSGSVHLWLGYDGSFRSGAQAHAAKAGVTVAF
jgi:hypothetical protein